MYHTVTCIIENSDGQAFDILNKLGLTNYTEISYNYRNKTSTVEIGITQDMPIKELLNVISEWYLSNESLLEFKVNHEMY